MGSASFSRSNEVSSILKFWNKVEFSFFLAKKFFMPVYLVYTTTFVDSKFSSTVNKQTQLVYMPRPSDDSTCNIFDYNSIFLRLLPVQFKVVNEKHN